MKDLLFFGEDWGGHPSTAQFIARKLLDNCRILWVDSLGYRTPNFNKRDARRIINKIANHFMGIRGPTENLFVCTPLVIPLQHLRAIRKLNALLLVLYLRSILKRIAFRNFTLITAGPAAEPIVGRLGEDRSVYYCADDYGTLPGISASLVKRLEKALANKVDLVIVTSQNLLTVKARTFSNVICIPHGVDYDHFAQARSDKTIIPNEMQSLKQPIIGYHGLIQDLIDMTLLEEMAHLRPHWNIVLIGDALLDVKKLPKKNNIYLLGKRPYELIPSYLKSFQVGLIPYKISRRTTYANPIKLREYLAAGIPVVSTPIPEVSKYLPHVRIGQNAHEFVAAIETFLAVDDEKTIKNRMEMMRSENWDKIAAKVLRKL